MFYQKQQAEYFVLSLEKPVGISTGIHLQPFTLSITIHYNCSSQEIQLDYIGSFDPSGTNSSTAEIVVHDPATQRLFATSAIAGF
jgi:hypothetical protein